MIRRDPASDRQVQAAAPGRSTWLSANAGSGKTRVLTDRVARLLLAEVDPQHILCLTYTKAAASEMQNRLFRRLGTWAMLDDDVLRGELEKMGAQPPFDLRRARTLFAGAIETPGGLKIQTIHSFCAAILRRFPLEAGVSPQFTEMEDRAADLLREEIVETLADGPHRDCVAAVAMHLTDETFAQLTAEITGNARDFAAPLTDAAINDLLGLPEGYDRARLLSDALPPDAADILASLIAALRTGTKTDQKNAETLASCTPPGIGALPDLESVFLFGSGAAAPHGAKIGQFPTKATRAALADLMPRVEDWMRRIEATRDRRLALSAAARMRALHDFAAVFVPAYEAAKQARGWLDFDDLILRTRDLLDDPSVAAWVLFRLDGGLDHILIDEAQDTSPAQWSVIERLAQEFTSGEGARSDTARTIFVVGDKKQSIYSFQGADPGEFDRMRDTFDARLTARNAALQVLDLTYSFRSAPAILSLVDRVFEGRERAGFAAGAAHRAFKDRLPGRVDLWPPVEKVKVDDDREWSDPVDLLGQRDHNVVLARSIANEIRAMLARGTVIPADQAADGRVRARRMRAGDVLILVQRRSVLFHEIIRACKDAGLPIAGADRLKVGGELAVRDLGALLAFLSTPEDDLALATALKSPLFGWDEQALFDLAHKRTQKRLWPALRDRAAEFPATMAILDDLRGLTDFLRPFDLIERILTRHDGRRRLLARLGEEAEDGIDALLSQALAYERNTVPSLTGFLVWMETDALEIKRQLDAAGDRIRVMTVHGAKGLEAPVVILPDSAARSPRDRNRLLRVGEAMAWPGPADATPAALRAARLRAQDVRSEESDRLLYVALTRAEKWLIVAAAGDMGTNGEAWHDRVRAGLEAEGATAGAFPTGAGLRLETGDWGSLVPEDTAPCPPRSVPLPALFRHPAPTAAPRTATLSPSDLGGAKALPGGAGLNEAEAKRRGLQVHLLLEHLTPGQATLWPGEAAALLSQGPDPAGDAERAILLEEAARILSAPSLAFLFAPDTLAEVPISADVPLLGGRLHGVIDRLVVDADRVLAVDFKTNAVVPERPGDCPDGLLRQMGAYALALAAVYPRHRIETAFLWTRNATLMPLPHDLVTTALATPLA